MRCMFSSLPEAKRGFGAGTFFIQHPRWTLRDCQGDGTVTVEMQFLADVERMICEECKGTRYKPTVECGTAEEYPRSSESDVKKR